MAHKGPREGTNSFRELIFESVQGVGAAMKNRQGAPYWPSQATSWAKPLALRRQ